MDREIIKISLKGDLCPYPLITALKKINEMEDDLKLNRKALRVVVDHPYYVRSIMREMGKRGYQTELEKTGINEWEITIRREIGEK
ncbi:MAG TPA: sulfurtransferase TusA family protein [bacterium (Candidatus Stahlbacteria)]|nr:sulfurtransferase TusA family protein [Candidatus Stahlbacteria bacterium]